MMASPTATTTCRGRDRRVGGAAGAARARDGALSGARRYDPAAVCGEQACTCPVTGARYDQVACIDAGCTAENAERGRKRAA